VAKLLSWGRRFVVGLTLGMWIDHQCGTLKTHAMADDPPQGAFSDTDEIDRTEEIAYVELETDQDAPIASQLANTGLPATWKGFIESWAIILSMAVVLGVFMGLAGLLSNSSSVRPLSDAAPSTDFSEQRSLSVLANLFSASDVTVNSRNTRVCGSGTTNLRQALLLLLQGVSSSASSEWIVEEDHQSLSGVAVATDDAGASIPAFYRNISSILVRVYPSSLSGSVDSAPALVYATHLDSLSPSVGVSEDLAPVAVFVETLRAVLASEAKEIHHALVFAFADCHYVPHQPGLSGIQTHPWLRKMAALVVADGLGVRYDASVGIGVVSGTHIRGSWQLIDVLTSSAMASPAIPIKMSTFRQEVTSDESSVGWAALEILNPENTVPSIGFEGTTGRRFQGTSRDSTPSAIIPGTMQLLGALLVRTALSSSWQLRFQAPAEEPSLSLTVVDIASRSIVALTRPGLMGLCIPLAVTYAASLFLYVWKLEEASRVKQGLSMAAYLKPYAVSILFPVVPALLILLFCPLIFQLLTFFNSLSYYQWIGLSAFHWCLWALLSLCFLLTGAQRVALSRDVSEPAILLPSTTALWNVLLLIIWWIPGPLSIYFIIFFNALMANLGLLVRFGLTQLVLLIRPQYVKSTPRFVYLGLDFSWFLIVASVPAFLAASVSLPALSLIEDIGLTNVRTICLPYGLLFIILGLNALPLLAHLRTKLPTALSVLGLVLIFYITTSAVPTYSTAHPKLIEVAYHVNSSAVPLSASFVISSRDYLSIDSRIPQSLNETTFSCEVPQQCFITASTPRWLPLSANATISTDTASQKTNLTVQIWASGCIFVDFELYDAQDAASGVTGLEAVNVHDLHFRWPSAKGDQTVHSRLWSGVCDEEAKLKLTLPFKTLTPSLSSIFLSVTAHYQSFDNAESLVRDIELAFPTVQVVRSKYGSTQFLSASLQSLVQS
jgi:hypothetical protein